jgi:hypothetical protein
VNGEEGAHVGKTELDWIEGKSIEALRWTALVVSQYRRSGRRLMASMSIAGALATNPARWRAA